jgi:hypothetical protein
MRENPPMVRALALKELRETAGIAILAALANMSIVAGMVGMQPFARVLRKQRGGVPFVETEFLQLLTFVAVALTLALGFRQAAWEANQGTYLYLLHRPVRRSAIFLTKLAVGIVLFMACTGVPILLYAWWAAMPRTHASPFEWAMTEPAWRFCLGMPLIYLGAFLSGLRPGRWYGTRLLPLACAGAFAAILLLFPTVSLIRLPAAVFIPALIVMYALLTTAICYVAEKRDY